ncbi:MAG: protease complex subunit PrcB family protein [Armatimonadetes bacterium]|nr:protease complex subunit PrcB family protein [Armatimonadota bacterium]
MRYFAWMLALVISAAAVAIPTVPGDPLHTVKWSNYRSGTTSRYEKESCQVLVNEGDFQRYWVQAMGQPSTSAPKDVDWNTYQLIAIHLGKRQTGGYSVFVRSVTLDVRDLAITYVAQSPGKHDRVSQNVTSPWVIIKVERNGGVARFVRTEQVGSDSGSHGGHDGYPGHAPGCLCCCCQHRHGSVGRNHCPHYPFEIIKYGYMTGSGFPYNYWINNSRDFANYWINVLGNDSKDLPDEGIDWRTNSIIAIQLDESTASQKISIEELILDNGKPTIRYSVDDQPGSGTKLRTFIIVRIPRVSQMPVIQKVAKGSGERY